MNSEEPLGNLKYVYDDDLWILHPKLQLEVLCHWQSKINPHNNKLYYINPRMQFE